MSPAMATPHQMDFWKVCLIAASLFKTSLCFQCVSTATDRLGRRCTVPQLHGEQVMQQILVGRIENAQQQLVFAANNSDPGYLRRAFPRLPWNKLPNFLTYIRCAAIPLLALVFFTPGRHVETALLFGAASFTDWLDGYLARRWNVTSDFGAFLDPVADKLMVSTALILLSGRYGATVAVPSSIILARELAVSALREWMAQRGLRETVKVGWQGKVKTALTMISVTILLLVPLNRIGFLGRLFGPALGMLFICSLITLSSGGVYFRAAASVLLGKGEE